MAADGGRPAIDMWPLFDALDGLPVAVVRGANSVLLTPEIVAKMRGTPAGPHRRRGARTRPRPLPRRARGAGGARRRSSPASPLTDIAAIRAAAARAARHPPHPAPLRRRLDRLAGRRLLVKAESLQVTGSFKARGGWAAISALARDERAARRPRLLLRQPRPGRRLGRGGARRAGGDPHALGRPRGEDRRHPRPRRRGRPLRPRHPRTATPSAPSSPRRAASPSSRPSTTRRSSPAREPPASRSPPRPPRKA